MKLSEMSVIKSVLLAASLVLAIIAISASYPTVIEDSSVRRWLEEFQHHKDLFPLDSNDIIGTILCVIGLMIAASGGIGGGGILVPLLILIFGFSPKMAIPLSNFTILGSSLTNLTLNLSKRHPDVDRPLVDWDLIMIMEPLTAAGAVCGTFLAKTLPDWALTLSLVVVLALTSHRTLKKGISQYKKEAEEFREAKRSALAVAAEEDEEADQSTGLLSDESTAVVSTTSSADPSKLEIEQGESSSEAHQQMTAEQRELEALIETERHTPMDKMYILIVMFAVLIVLNLVKGGGKSFPSPIGIECGSFSYWMVTLSIFVWVFGIALYMRQELIKKWRQKKRLRYKYAPGDVEWNERNTLIYPALCVFAGFCAGMFGIGGGVVKGPLMLEMGVHPMVASGTVAVMIFMTAIAATTSFIAFGTLTYDYAYYLFVFGLGATAIGQFGVGYLVKKYKRVSLISLSIGAVVALSTVLMGLQSVLSLLSGNEEESNKLCT
mmetsp:Transcript_13011/g.19628  ORF Transcript_13011/g.19628 Transcript_13011/m.19628 type:complete len:493 (+) Transcript_13011:103-1581(+)